jgi:hypothetical protein
MRNVEPDKLPMSFACELGTLMSWSERAETTYPAIAK